MLCCHIKESYCSTNTSNEKFSATATDQATATFGELMSSFKRSGALVSVKNIAFSGKEHVKFLYILNIIIQRSFKCKANKLSVFCLVNSTSSYTKKNAGKQKKKSSSSNISGVMYEWGCMLYK
jgi:hypothetical protein